MSWAKFAAQSLASLQIPEVAENTAYRAHVPVTATADQSWLLVREPCPGLQVRMSLGGWVWNPHLLLWS